jgi:hypothetical protein
MRASWSADARRRRRRDRDHRSAARRRAAGQRTGKADRRRGRADRARGRGALCARRDRAGDFRGGGIPDGGGNRRHRRRRRVPRRQDHAPKANRRATIRTGRSTACRAAGICLGQAIAFRSIYGHFWSQPDLSQPDFSVYDGEDSFFTSARPRRSASIRFTKSARRGDALDGSRRRGCAVCRLARRRWRRPGRPRPRRRRERSAAAARKSRSSIPARTSSLVPASVYSSPSVGGTELPRTGDPPPRGRSVQARSAQQTSRFNSIGRRRKA